MRLTLRTLLAYLDGVLSKEDLESLHDQIESSEFASELVHRTRDATRRLKLGAPEPLGTGPVDDPNTVAEYLDNTLPQESVPEFERVCLESDMMLAEAASCHHVLKMVLETPGEIDPDTRARLHRLKDELREAQQAQAEASAAPAAPAAAPVHARPHHPTAPDYLKETPPSALGRWAPAIAAMALLGLMSYLAFGPGGWLREPVIAKVDPPAAAEGGPVAEEAVATPTDPTETEPEAAATTEEATPEEPATAETSSDEGTTATPESEPAEPESATPEATDPETPSPESAETQTPTTEATDPLAVTEPPETEPASPEDAAPATEASEGATAEPAEPAAEEPPAPEPPPVVGLFAGPENTLLLSEAAPGSWRRVTLGSEVEPSTRMLSMPTYRPRIEAAEGLRIELVGLTDLAVAWTEDEAEDEPNDEESSRSPRLELRHGRIVAELAADAEPLSIELVIDGAASRVELAPGASLAVEVDRPYQPGLETAAQSAPLVATAYAPSGNVVWTLGRNQLTIGDPSRWSLAEAGLSGIQPYEGGPEWITPQPLPAWDQLASPVVPSRIAADREVWPQLLELVAGESYKEVRSLAARCALAVGHAEPLVASFTEEAQRSLWRDNLAALRQAASRDRGLAESVERAFVEKYGQEQASGLITLLHGFGEDPVDDPQGPGSEGALPAVLESLESESLAVRAMASLNLDELTGRQQAFDPLGSPVKRRNALRRLRKDLQEGELRRVSR